MTKHIVRFSKNANVQLILWLLYAAFTVANGYLAIRNFPILERIARLEYDIEQIREEQMTNRPLINRYLVTESQTVLLREQIIDINRKLDLLIQNQLGR